jgi:protein phosphatase
MGTTLTAILFAGNKLGLVHIGDSRGYLLRDGELAQITKDDTFVQTLVDEGRITAEEAHSHPQRSLIMRALTGHEVEPTLIMREARVGDRYLLCSDGLSDPVSQETILEALQIPDVAESADRLIELALRGGGPDNVTVVVADVVDDDFGGQTQPIVAGAVSGDDGNIAPPNTAAGRASAINPRPTAPAKRIVGEPEAPEKRPRSWRRIGLAAALLVILLVGGSVVGYMIIRSYYYVTAHAGTVSVMRGVQASLPGFPLQEPYLVGCLTDRNELQLLNVDQQPKGCHLLSVNDLRPSERTQVIAGLPIGSLDKAKEQIRELVKTSLLPLCEPTVPPTQTPTPSPSSQTSTSEVPPSTSPTTSSSAPGRTESNPPESPGSGTTSATTSPPSSPATTSEGTTLPPAPQQPGTTCRTAA